MTSAAPGIGCSPHGLPHQIIHRVSPSLSCKSQPRHQNKKPASHACHDNRPRPSGREHYPGPRLTGGFGALLPPLTILRTVKCSSLCGHYKSGLLFWAFAMAVQARASDGSAPGHFTGRAVDDQGQPVAGAAVECYQDASQAGANTAQEFALKERGTTDSKGGFTVSAVGGTTIVVVKKEGLAPGWRTFRLRPRGFERTAGSERANHAGGLGGG